MKVRNDSPTPVRINRTTILPRQTMAIDDAEWVAWCARASGNRRLVESGKLVVVEEPRAPAARRRRKAGGATDSTASGQATNGAVPGEATA